MRIIFIGLIMLFLGCTQNVSLPPEETIVTNSLFEIQSRFKTGINLIEYRQLVSDTRVAIDQYSRSGKADLQKKAVMETVMLLHELNLRYWNCKITDNTLIQSKCQELIAKEIAANLPNTEMAKYYTANRFKPLFDVHDEFIVLMFSHINMTLQPLKQTN